MECIDSNLEMYRKYVNNLIDLFTIIGSEVLILLSNPRCDTRLFVCGTSMGFTRKQKCRIGDDEAKSGKNIGSPVHGYYFEVHYIW